jgi:hypothetical protein
MNDITGNAPVEWLLPAAPAAEWLSLTIDVAEPSPGARICYTATEHPRWARPGSTWRSA